MTSNVRNKSLYISLEPTTLYFPPPHSNRSIKNELGLYNRHPTKSAVFKIKSVNPDRYIVVPACGVIKALGVVKISITLKPVSNICDPSAEDDDDKIAEYFKKEKFKCSAKFITIPINNKINPSQLWAAQEGTDVDYETSINAFFTAKETTNIPASSSLNMLPIPLILTPNPKSVKFGDVSGGPGTTGSILKKGDIAGDEVEQAKSRIMNVANRIHLQTEKRDSLVKQLEDLQSMQTLSEISDPSSSKTRQSVITDANNKVAVEGRLKTLSVAGDTEESYDGNGKEANKKGKRLLSLKTKRMCVIAVLLGMILAYTMGLFVRHLLLSDWPLQLSLSTVENCVKMEIENIM